ncbi:homogentisate 1,2-dioxygenase [Pelagimonas varians]|uniref:homogentisate 1,2-dioxygenase n=1 Tax=Pelagimonas varians TaxID=696760 RepID=UPI003521FA6F
MSISPSRERIVPEIGALRALTGFGRIDVALGKIVCIPSGINCKVLLNGDDRARGYISKNYGAVFPLPSAQAVPGTQTFFAPAVTALCFLPRWTRQKRRCARWMPKIRIK